VKAREAIRAIPDAIRRRAAAISRNRGDGRDWVG
jgi:hypothetical protein